MKSVLVTGGAGFIGSHIVDILVEQGLNVTVLDNLSSGCRQQVHQDARLIEADIRDYDAVMRLFGKHSFDAVIHHAAQTKVTSSIESPCYDSGVNIQGTVNLLECCRRYGVQRFVYPSSAAVYGIPTILPLCETAATAPISFYGLSKLVPEHYICLYHDLFGLEYVIFRYANVYGERQGSYGEGGVVNVFVRALLAGNPITVFGDGEQTRDFIYVRDIAHANYQALTCVAPNFTINISTGQAVSVNKLIRELELALGCKVKRKNSPERAGDIRHSVLDNTAARQKLAWLPRMLLRDGLKRTAEAVLHV